LQRKLLAADAPADVQVHAAKQWCETADWRTCILKPCEVYLTTPIHSCVVQAAEALAKHPAVETIAVARVAGCDHQKDYGTYHGIRIALRDQLRKLSVADALVSESSTDARKNLSRRSDSTSGPASAIGLRRAVHGSVSDEVLATAINAGAKYIDVPRVDAIIRSFTAFWPKSDRADFPAARIGRWFCLSAGCRRPRYFVRL